MSLDQICNKALEELFKGYLENPGGIYTIREIVSQYGVDAQVVGNYLVKHGWVKDQQFLVKDFGASINLAGIMKINPRYLKEKKDKVISTLGINGNPRSSIMETLELPTKDFQFAFDIVKYLESLDLIEAQFSFNEIIIQLKQKGLEYYQKNKADFLEL